MLRRTKLLLLVPFMFCILGLATIPNASAGKPVKHLTYGDVMAAFQNHFHSGSIIYIHANEHAFGAAPADGARGRINPLPWIVNPESCVNDGHYVSITWIGWFIQTPPEASEWAKWRKEHVQHEFYLMFPEESTWTDLDEITTPTKPHTFWDDEVGEWSEDWAYTVGAVFRPGELPDGDYLVRYELYIDGVLAVLVMNSFHIHACTC